MSNIHTAYGNTDRTYIIDRMFQYSMSLKLMSDVTYMAIEILDTYAKSYNPSVDKLKIMSIASLYVSNKYLEKDTVTLDSFIGIIDEYYTKYDILNAEIEIVGHIMCENIMSSHIKILRSYNTVMYVTYMLGRYLMDLSTLYALTHKYPGDILIASIFMLCIRATQDTYMTSTDIYNRINYTKEEIRTCMSEIFEVWKMAKCSDLFIFRKYRHPICCSVADLDLRFNESE